MDNRQDIYEFLDKLQKEYLVTCLRRKIYLPEKDKEFFTRLLMNKEEKIRQIGFRIGEDKTIFGNWEEFERYCELIFPSFKNPNYFYTEESRIEYERKDHIYYFIVGGTFKWNIDISGGAPNIGVIQDNDGKEGILRIGIEISRIVVVPLENLERIHIFE